MGSGLITMPSLEGGGMQTISLDDTGKACLVFVL